MDLPWNVLGPIITRLTFQTPRLPTISGLGGSKGGSTLGNRRRPTEVNPSVPYRVIRPPTMPPAIRGLCGGAHTRTYSFTLAHMQRDDGGRSRTRCTTVGSMCLLTCNGTCVEKSGVAQAPTPSGKIICYCRELASQEDLGKGRERQCR